MTVVSQDLSQAKLKGPWSVAEIEQFLSSTVFPLRLGCVGADGYPRVVSVWFHYAMGQLFCVTHRDSHLLKLLRANSRVGFEVAPNEPPYHGVRGQGEATLASVGGDRMLEELLQRYLGGVESGLANWLLARKDEETLVTISPTRLFSWDYRSRMDDIASTGSSGNGG
jgi:nitroimidazol reductase NimA-like FMN-containing flavoprotein (pyridoxamine 5'-phosphate oxidase superfamily)